MPLDFWSHIGKSLGRIGAGTASGAVTGGVAGAVTTAPAGGVGAIPGAIVGGIGGGVLGAINAVQGWGGDDQEADAQAQAQAAQQGVQQQVATLQAQANPYDAHATDAAVMANNNAVAQQYGGAGRALRGQLAARGLLGSGAEGAGYGAIDAGQAAAMSQGQLGIQQHNLDQRAAWDQNHGHAVLEALTGQQNTAQAAADLAYQRQAQQDQAVGSTISGLGQTAMLLPQFAGAPAQAAGQQPGPNVAAGDLYGPPEGVHQPIYPTPTGQALPTQPGAYPMRNPFQAGNRGDVANQMRWRLGGLTSQGVRAPARTRPSLGYSPIFNNDGSLDQPIGGRIQ